MRVPFALLALLLGVAPPCSLAQQTIQVPANQPTIQAGIDAANNGDTVLVAPGTYFENINFKGKTITVTSSGGAAGTVIDGALKAPAVVFSTSETRASILSGFTIQHGGVLEYPFGYPTGGIYLNHSSPTIRDNILTQNSCWTIYSTSSAPLIQNNVISATQDPQGHCSFAGGAGVFVSGNLNGNNFTNIGGPALIIGNTIENNIESGLEDAGGNGGAGLAVWGGSPIIMNNIIRNNASPGGNGGAINVEAGNGVAIVQNLMYGNSAGCGGGALAVQANPDPRTGISALVASNTMVNNTGQGSGGFSSCASTSQIYPSPASYGFSDPSIIFINNVVSGSTTYPAIDCAVYGPNGEAYQPTFQADILFNAGGPFFGSHCVDVSGKYNNLAVDPQFVSLSAGDFHLRSTSPAINHGQNNALQLFGDLTGLNLTTDLDGNPRVLGGTSQASAVIDMGAYEFQSQSPSTLALSCNPLSIPLSGMSSLFAVLSSPAALPTATLNLTDNTATLAQLPLINGTATYTYTGAMAGQHTLTVTFAATSTLAGSSASCAINVVGLPSTATLNVTPTGSTFGSPVTLTAHVAAVHPPGTGVPTGSVTFLNGGTTLGAVPLSAGSSTLTVSSLPGGNDPISCTYSGDVTYAPSTCNSVPVTVVPAATTLTLTSSASPAPVSPSPLITVHLTAGGLSVPPGTAIQISFGPNASQTLTVDATGSASIAVPPLPPGTYTITAAFPGSNSLLPSSASLTQILIGFPTSTTLGSTPNPAYAGQAVSLTATVASTTNAPTPSGTVAFFDGNTGLGSAPLNGSGQATFATSALTIGSHLLTATFATTGQLLTSTSAAIQQQILPSTFAIALSPASIALGAGKEGTIAVNLASVGGFSGPLSLRSGPLPVYATSVFAPSAVTLTPGGAASASLLLNTAQLAAHTRQPAGPPWSMALAAFLMPFGLWRSCRRRRHALAACTAALLCLSITGCGTLGTPFHLVPQGTYQVPISAVAADGTQKAAMLTVVITP